MQKFMFLFRSKESMKDYPEPHINSSFNFPFLGRRTVPRKKKSESGMETRAFMVKRQEANHQITPTTSPQNATNNFRTAGNSFKE